MSARRLLSSVLLSPFLVSLAAAPAAAQHHFNHRPGLPGAGAGGDGAIDSIDPFNGHLALAIPLGNAYPVSGSLSYGLTLVYNGNVWDSQERSDGFNLYTQSIPSRRSNAGLGWLVSLGRLSPPSGDPGNTSGRWMYIGPDGSEHLFYPTLHPGETAVANVFYSRDGSYLRLKLLPGDLYEVEHPGGAIHKFAKAGAEYRLTQIRDRFTSSLAVSYPDAYTWQLSDNHGRTHYVRFEDDATFGKRVKEVDLAAFNAARAKYLFGYAAGVWVERGCPDDDPTTAPNVQVTLLTSVGILVDGSTYSYSMPASDYTAGDGNDCDRTSGHIQRITLPTGGKIGWTWRSYVFPTTENLFFQQSAGIASRTVYDAAGAALGTWTYETSLVIDPDFKKRELKNAVTDPLGHKTVRYFSVDLEGNFSTEGWSRYDYGLPFTRKQAQGTSPIRYLSSETFDSAGTKLRSTYVRYERDKVEGLPQNEWDFNRRLVSSRTVFDTDGGRYADVTYSDFDGLGHYRTAVLGGNFGAGDSRTETTAFNPARGTYKIDPASNQPAAGHTYTAWPDTAAWVLGTFDSQTAIEGTSTAKSEACFEAATGFLLRARVLKGTGQGNRDVIARFTKDTAGNLTAEESFGGENQSLAAGALCSLSLPAAEYRTDHTFQYGVLRTSQISGMPFKSVDRDIDLSTGMIKTSRDSSLLATTFDYDALGRPTWVKPAQSGWTQTAYTTASGATPAKVLIYRRPNGSGATLLASEEVHLDPFGRTAVERVKLPDGTWSDRRTYYTAHGWVSNRTEWGTALSTSYSGFDPFGRPTSVTPPDGAAHKVTFAYTGDRVVSRTLKVGTAWNATTSSVTETNAAVTEIYDRQGRLYQVFEPANPDGTNTTTTYLYDIGGRLTRVTQTGKQPGSTQNVTQTRVFTYDNRGFLISQQHPEKGASGNGVVSYTKHDSRGNPGQMTDGPNDLRFTYDKAGRLTLLEESFGFGTYRPAKQLTYATANGTGDYRLGKLQIGTRYNYPSIGATSYSVPVTETYTYAGKQGAVSKRDTSLTVAANGGPPGTPTTFTQSWTWNDLGQLASVTYPRCTHAACTAGTSRTVTPTYTNGFLTAVSGYASSITYHSNGQLNQVTHMNNPASSATWVTDTFYKDPQSIARPQKIDAKLGSTVLWNSGAYSYDGAGNLVKAGSSYYLYDKVSRVADGLQYTGPGAGGTTVVFDHEYDGFGNLHSLTTGATPSLRPTPTNPATNRLSGFASYDSAGNLTGWNGAVHEYDRLNMMRRMTNGTEDWIYLYTVDDERIWTFSVNGQPSRWTLRDLDGKVLREYKDTGTAWSIQRDYVYRGGLLLAAHTADASPKDLVQYHLDHLGTLRATTDRNGTRITYSVYYPFGEEITNVTTERMKFTGHERDLNSTASKDDDLDYMHARFYNPLTGRFTSFDSVGGQSGAPQSWNRSAYVLGNPVNLVDPKGLFWGLLGWRMPTFGEVITVTGSPYDFGGLAGFFHFSFFLQNIHYLLTPAVTLGAQPSPPPPPPWVNPTNNCQRGCDARGCGNFGARRVRNGVPGTHNGADYLATVGQDVAAPASGTINRSLQVYPGNPQMRGFAMTTTSGFAVKVFYVSLDPSLVGTTAAAGDVVGTAQDVASVHPGTSNHVHVEIRDSNGNLIDPGTLIPQPSGCP